MKRLFSAALLVSIPLFLLALVIQSARFQSLLSDVRLAERRQQELVAANRALLIDLARESSRATVGAAAEAAAANEALVPIGPTNSLRIEVRPPIGEGNDG